MRREEQMHGKVGSMKTERERAGRGTVQWACLGRAMTIIHLGIKERGVFHFGLVKREVQCKRKFKMRECSEGECQERSRDRGSRKGQADKNNSLKVSSI